MSERPPINNDRKTDINDDRLIDAALWLERITSGEEEYDEPAFQYWLSKSPLNAIAFQHVKHTYDDAKYVGDSTEILALRQQTLARIALRRREFLPRGLSFLRKRPVEKPDDCLASSRIGKIRVALAAGLAACIVTSVWLGVKEGGPFQQQSIKIAEIAPAEILYRTSIGEQATIELADGSQITLNTDTAVRVAYSPAARRLILDQGQAFFTVAKDKGRPFTVEANGKIVTAFGTAFDVRIQKEKVRVALLEGVVSVSPSRSTDQGTVTLRPNDMLIADKNALDVVKLANPASLTAWRDGMIIFQNEDLRSAVDEINRYSSKRIILDGDEISQLKISGTFRTGQINAFIEALHGMFPIKSESRGANEILLTKK